MASAPVLTLLGALALAAGCARRAARGGDSVATSDSIETVLAAHTDSLMRVPGVVGTALGICDGAPCIRIFVADSSAAERGSLPTRLGGYPVRVEVTGPIRAREHG